MSLGKTPNQLRDVGLSAFNYFHSEAAGVFPQNYAYSLEQARQLIDNELPLFFQLLGKAVLISNDSDNPKDPLLTDSQIEQIMKALADNNQGNLPTHMSEFLKAFTTSEVPTWGWTDSLIATAQGVADTGEVIATNVGDVSSAVVSNAGAGLVTLAKWLPYVVVGLGALYVLSISGGLGTVVSKAKSAVGK